MLYFIEILRTIAVIFILNSHFDALYPIDLAIGGEFGLALFFIITGFLSSNIKSDTKFVKWIIKKFLRIYIPIIVLNIINIALYKKTLNSFGDIFLYFIYPTNHWFVSFIMILYIIFYFTKKYVFTDDVLVSQKRVMIAIGALLGVYFVNYLFLDNTQPHNVTYFWHTKILWIICAFTGLLIKELGIIQKAKKHRKALIVLSVLFTLMYGGFKILYVLRRFLAVQFLCFFAPIAASICFFIFLGTLEEEIKKFFKNKKIFTVVELFSKASLEIYLVQFYFIEMFASISFPINVLLTLICTLACANILHYATDYLSKLMLHEKQKKVSA